MVHYFWSPKKNRMKIKLTIFCLFVVFNLQAQEPQLNMQAWYWDYPKTADGNSWADTLRLQAPELAEAGFTHLWFPPHTVASFGLGSNGYDPKDLFIGNQTTGLGSRAALDAMLNEFASQGIDPVADMIYNHRDGGEWENNPAVTKYIFDDGIGTLNGGNPFPNDRYRLILPLGGTSGNGAGEYYFKFSSKSNGFANVNYQLYMWTNTINGFDGTVNEVEPNGGAGCSEGFNDIPLITNFNGTIDAMMCTVDELRLTITPSDFDPAGDTLYIQVKANGGGYHDFRPFEVWNAAASANVVTQIVAQTATNFNNMPSGRGGMNYNAFRPNDSDVNFERLDGEWNTMYFFNDYDHYFETDNSIANTALRDTLNAWTEWNYDALNVRGIRMDAIKHFNPGYVASMLNYMYDQGKAPSYVVGEWFDTDRTAHINWINSVLAGMSIDAKNAIDPKIFDFSLRESLRAACDDFGNDVRNVFTSSLFADGLDGKHISTFVNNHDFRNTPGTGFESLINNDPVLAYAYILLNNKLGVPTIFYPDYYGYPTGASYPWHPTGQEPLQYQIDLLWDVHKKYIAGADRLENLNAIGSAFIADANYISGAPENSLIFQVGNTSISKSTIVAINFSGDTLKVDHKINTFSGAIAQGEKFTDLLQVSPFAFAEVDNLDRIYMEVPPRSYAIWVEDEPCPMVKRTTDVPGVYMATFECEEDGWTHYYNESDGELKILFSVEKGSTGVDIPLAGVKQEITGGSGAIDLSTAPYVTNADGWYVMRRYWDVDPTTQPTLPLRIRSYFTQQDLADLSASPAAFDGTLNDLAFYRITNNKDPNPSNGHADVTFADYSEATEIDYVPFVDGDVYYAEYEIPSFSGGGGGSGGAMSIGALPVQLGQFTATIEANHAVLDWSTLSEQNIYGFAVERSLENDQFEQIGFVSSMGSIHTFTPYQFVDVHFSGSAYYRLRIIDASQQEEFSRVVYLSSETNSSQSYHLLYSENSPVRVESSVEGEVGISVVDVLGRIYFANQATVNQLNEFLQHNSSQFSNGIYYIVIKDKNGTHTLKMMAQ